MVVIMEIVYGMFEEGYVMFEKVFLLVINIYKEFE